MSKNTIDLNINDYTEKSFVVRGDTMSYKNELKMMGGKWNSRLKDGAGWIFPKTKKNEVKQFIENGTVTQNNDKKLHSHTISIHKKIDELTNRVVNIETLLKQLLSHKENMSSTTDCENNEEHFMFTHKRLLM